jgi:hypothetical protein
MKYSRLTLFLLLFFWPLTALVLFLDSRGVADSGANGQLLANIIAPVFLLLLMTRLQPRQQLMVALFVPLSAMGEGVFSLLFGLYEYRLHAIPLYVPFGHSILMSVGLLLSQSEYVQQNLRRVQVTLLVFHGVLIGGALLFFGDTLSTLWAAIFLLLLRRQCAQPFYLILGVLVLYIEILGTAWGCWVWRPDPFGVLQTTNPPPGAFTCYVIGDIVAMYAGSVVAAQWRRWRLPVSRPAVAET